ncbi:unnamed protein product [Nesidiocoris tenuis]|uniref:Mitochondrial ribosomal protein L53 n=2 Tax=Nesidiocoris tenuis TaxID=355587 RepID=A0ABN7AK65_9HEMI|nr:mitochondrial ribosomal protein L53 [Nesidiocoris tenuis]CAB0003603.1 unnamed protein product [Nesidiocoris tenuis]
MSLLYTGAIGFSGGLLSAVSKELRTLSLKPVKRVIFQFDPFHEKVEQTRLLMYYLNSKRVNKTNLQCVLRSNVVCDRSDPLVTFKLVSGHDVVFKSKNLSLLEMLKLYNEHITVLVPKEEPVAVVSTKATKSASVKKLNKKR